MNKFKHFKGKKAYVDLKLNMEKAYDRIEWDFLLSCLKQLGFRDTWIRWIKECISMVSCSLIINDKPSDFFKPTRGLNQEDSLSPYLFTICMDVLAHRLHAQFLKAKSGIWIKLAPCATHITMPSFFRWWSSLLQSYLSSLSKIEICSQHLFVHN